MEGAACIQLIHLCSGTFPIGTFSHSYGFEYMVKEGNIKGSEDFEQYLKGLLSNGFGKTDLPVIKLAYESPERFEELDTLCTALKPTKEIRSASLKTGRAFIRVFGSMYPGSLPETKSGLNYATAFGIACRHLEIPLSDALECYTAGTLISYIQAGIKLIPLSQTDGQIIMKNCYGEIEKCAKSAAKMNEEDMFSFTPFTDISSMLHERQYSRMYMS